MNKHNMKNIYVRNTATDFKHRYNNHTKSLDLEYYENDREPSKECWAIKRNLFAPKVTGRIFKCAAFNTTKGKCYLCLDEKLRIASYKGYNLLKNKSEFINKCRHQNKFTHLQHDSKG